MSFFSRIPFIIISISIFFSCAVKQGPSGGEKDTTPPAIIAIEPEPGSVGIPVDTKFSVLFSKPMKPEKTENAVFLSPVFWDYPLLKWSGKKLTITPPEPLKENVTYVLTIGAGATGHHGNRLGASFSYPFSTGDAIDSGSIAGAVYIEKGRPTTFDIWAYEVGDSVNPVFLTEIPDYATQVDSLGGFEIINMAPGNYIVLAVDDKNDDLFWEPTSESIGLPPSIIRLTGIDDYGRIVLRPERRDTIPASISRVKPLDNRKITVEFSQPVYDKLKLDIKRYAIISSDSSVLEIEGVYVGGEGMLILETAAQEQDVSYKLTVTGFISKWGVRFDSSGVRFGGVSRPDTTAPKLISSLPDAGSRSVYNNSTVELIFSERIKTYGFNKLVNIVADSLDTLSFRPEWKTPNKVALTINGGIPREKPINVVLKPQSITDVAGNSMSDSALSFTFMIAPADTVGFVTVKTSQKGVNIGELYSKQGNQYTVEAGNDGVFNYGEVLPGTYYFRYFNDLDSNGVWSPGVIKPFQPAEWFAFLRDSIDVRARWTTDLGLID